MVEKICSKCRIPKLTEEFNKSKHGKHGVRGTCRDCDKEYTKLWYQKKKTENPDYLIKKYLKEKEQYGKEV